MNTQRRPPAPADRELLAGTIEHVGFHSPDNGFCVLTVKARGERNPLTVVGRAATINPGEWLTATGQWVNHPTYGPQFKVHFLRTSAPSSAAGIERYLRSGMMRGIGRVYAHELVKAFGNKVLDSHRHRARAAPGSERHRPHPGPPHHRGVGGAEGRTRDHAVPARPRRGHGASGADLQDLRERRSPDDQREPLPPRTRDPPRPRRAACAPASATRSTRRRRRATADCRWTSCARWGPTCSTCPAKQSAPCTRARAPSTRGGTRRRTGRTHRGGRRTDDDRPACRVDRNHRTRRGGALRAAPSVTRETTRPRRRGNSGAKRSAATKAPNGNATANVPTKMRTWRDVFTK